MGGDRGVRHRCKGLLYSMEQELRSDYGLSAIESRALVQRFVEFVDQVLEADGGGREAGQVRVMAVAAGQPAGRPVSQCVTVPILLTLVAPTDAEVQRTQGSRGLRQARLLRLVHEARGQSGLLSYEDLAAILGLDLSTIKRLTAALRVDGLRVPTRGVMHDMGRAPSHKEPIGCLLCRGYVYTEITAITGHTEHSSERYALDLGRVITLADLGTAPNDIRVICELSEAALDCYLSLYREHNSDEFRQHLDTLKRRFESGKGIVGPGQLLPRKPAQDPLKLIQERDYTCAVSRLLKQTLAITTPVADMVAKQIAALDGQVFAGQQRLLPGQTILLVESAASAPKYSGHTAADRPLVPVVLSPWTPDKILHKL